MISVNEALAHVLALAPAPQVQDVALDEALGRVLLEPAYARRAQPPFDASAMDGYATVGPVSEGMVLQVIGESRAGHGFAGKVAAGEAVRIFTGAPLPEGADFVVIQEDVSRNGAFITLQSNLSPGPHIRRAGVDFAKGAAITDVKRLGAADLALLAAMNCPRLGVARRPLVAIVSTGDELALPGEAMGEDQIIASNLYALRALAQSAGAEVRVLPIARDTREALRDVLIRAQEADVIVSSGGVSVGDYDLVGEVAAELGLQPAFYKVAIRPGKPLLTGRMGRSIFMGLPGNPVSAYVTAYLFLLPLLRRMQGLADVAPPLGQARLTSALPQNGPRAHYMRAKLGSGPEGIEINAGLDQDSSLLVALSRSDALLVRPPNDPARQIGEIVSFHPL